MNATTCPACGAEVTEDDTRCPDCDRGLDSGLVLRRRTLFVWFAWFFVITSLGGAVVAGAFYIYYLLAWS